MIRHFRHAELVSASIPGTTERVEKWTLKQVQGDGRDFAVDQAEFRQAINARWFR